MRSCSHTLSYFMLYWDQYLLNRNLIKCRFFAHLVMQKRFFFSEPKKEILGKDERVRQTKGDCEQWEEQGVETD